MDNLNAYVMTETTNTSLGLAAGSTVLSRRSLSPRVNIVTPASTDGVSLSADPQVFLITNSHFYISLVMLTVNESTDCLARIRLT